MKLSDTELGEHLKRHSMSAKNFEKPVECNASNIRRIFVGILAFYGCAVAVSVWAVGHFVYHAW